LILVPEEVAAAAAELSRGLGRTVAPHEFLFEKVRQHEPFEWECTFVRKNGTRFPVDLSVTALRDSAGEITGLVGIARDATCRRNTERALRESEERSRMALQSLAQAHEQALDASRL